MGLSRRALTLAVATALAIAACSSDGDSPSRASKGDEPSASEDVDPNGVLRYAYGVSNLNFDPTRAATPADFVHQHLIYGTVLEQDVTGDIVPGLAAEAVVVDPRTIELRLRPGLRFQDGTPLDAAAAKFGLERNVKAKVEPESPGAGTAFRVELGEISTVEVVDDLRLRLNLKSDTAGAVYSLLASNEGMLVSPTAARGSGADLNRSPVGAGAFRFGEYENDRRLRLEKWDGHWKADDVRLAAIEFVHTPTPESMVNALKSNAVDYVFAGAAESDPYQGPGIQVDVRPSDNSMYWMPICKSKPPFDDVRVRRALNYALDRDAMNEVLFEGRGEPQWGVWTSNHRLYSSRTKGIYDHDPEKAKALLQEAGVQDLSFDVMIIPIPSLQSFAEMAQAQWREIGVRANLVSAGNIVEDFFVQAKAPLGAIPYTNRGITKLAGNFYPGSLANVCKYDDPKMNSLIDKIRVLREDSPDATEAWLDAQEYVAEQALVVFGVFTPLTSAWNERAIGGVKLRLDALGRPMPDFSSVYVVKRS